MLAVDAQKQRAIFTMPPKTKTTKSTRTTLTIDTRKLEKLIRDSVHSEMTAQQSRKRTADAYTQRLNDTDTKVTAFIQQAITETTRAYRLSVNSFIFSYISAFLLLATGIVLVFFSPKEDQSMLVPGIFIAGSIIWMISLQNRNLSKNNRSLVTNLAKLNIIFAGYTRQIHQVDAVFEEIVGSSDGITVPVAEQLLNNLQEAMADAMSSVSAISVELEE